MVNKVWNSLFHIDKISNATYFPNQMGTIPNASIKSCNPTVYLFLKFIYFNWRLITLQYGSGFCHTLTWTSHGCTCVPHSEPSSHLSPHPIPQGHPSAPALSTLSHASNLEWRSVSHMIIYMFQCYSLRSSHPHLYPQILKTVLYICVLLHFKIRHSFGSSFLFYIRKVLVGCIISTVALP